MNHDVRLNAAHPGLQPARIAHITKGLGNLQLGRQAPRPFDGLDQAMIDFEDVDLSFRLRLAGWRVLQAPDATVHHVGGGVAGARNAFTDFHGARNRTWTFIKCMPSALLWPLMPVYIASSMLVMSVASLRGRGFASWRGMFAAFADLGPILATRRGARAPAISRACWLGIRWCCSAVRR